MALVDVALGDARDRAGEDLGRLDAPDRTAISIATPPKRCSIRWRKKWTQSELTHRRWGSLGLKPSDSACWLTLDSVAIARPPRSSAWTVGMSWSSTYGYDDQHWRRLAGSYGSAKRSFAGCMLRAACSIAWADRFTM